MNKNGITYTVIFSFILGALFVIPLAFAYESTKPLVARNEIVSKNSAILKALGIGFSAGDADEISALVSQRLTIRRYQVTPEAVTPLSAEAFAALQATAPSQAYELFEAAVDGETRYALQVAGPGLWGTITTIMAFNSDLSRLAGLAVKSHSETPGLGARIDEPWFQAQVTGEAFIDGAIDVVAGGGRDNKDDGRVDAITGATRTSEAMAGIFSLGRATAARLLGGN